MKYVFGFMLFASSAFAADPQTVTLTQDQLQRLIQAEAAKAVAGFVAQEKAVSAKDAYEAVEKAFAPKPAPSDGK